MCRQVVNIRKVRLKSAFLSGMYKICNGCYVVATINVNWAKK